jgi:hypothetical protein
MGQKHIEQLRSMEIANRCANTFHPHPSTFFILYMSRLYKGAKADSEWDLAPYPEMQLLPYT